MWKISFVFTVMDDHTGQTFEDQVFGYSGAFKYIFRSDQNKYSVIT